MLSMFLFVGFGKLQFTCAISVASRRVVILLALNKGGLMQDTYQESISDPQPRYDRVRTMQPDCGTEFAKRRFWLTKTWNAVRVVPAIISNRWQVES
jgi:hypothetical protein